MLQIKLRLYSPGLNYNLTSFMQKTANFSYFSYKVSRFLHKTRHLFLHYHHFTLSSYRFTAIRLLFTNTPPDRIQRESKGTL
jgi:hypothetical protein